MTTLSTHVQKEFQNTFCDSRLPSILVVDDLPDQAISLCALLEKHSYKTHAAFGWETALAVARAQLPDIILLDLGMPELDGAHLARLFREDERLKDKVLVAVTGYCTERHQQQCKLAGFDRFLAKPVVWADLKSTLDSLWSKRAVQ